MKQVKITCEILLKDPECLVFENINSSTQKTFSKVQHLSPELVIRDLGAVSTTLLVTSHELKDSISFSSIKFSKWRDDSNVIITIIANLTSMNNDTTFSFNEDSNLLFNGKPVSVDLGFILVDGCRNGIKYLDYLVTTTSQLESDISLEDKITLQLLQLTGSSAAKVSFSVN